MATIFGERIWGSGELAVEASQPAAEGAANRAEVTTTSPGSDGGVTTTSRAELG